MTPNGNREMSKNTFQVQILATLLKYPGKVPIRPVNLLETVFEG